MSTNRSMPVEPITRCLSSIAISATLLAAWGLALPAAAQEPERELGLKNTTELGLVITDGNSNTANFNVRNLLTYDWQQAELDWELGYLRASSDEGRFAVGTPDAFELTRPEREPDNDRLFTNLRYRRDIDETFFWYARLYAERDQPANIDYRFTQSAGAGNTWVEGDALTFLTGYGLSYTAESLELTGDTSFAGYQLFYNLAAQATDTTLLESILTFDGSVEEGDDFRFDWFNGAGVAVNDSIALKAGLRLLYRNQPALEDLVLRSPAGAVAGSVIVGKEKLDSAITTSLVITL